MAICSLCGNSSAAISKKLLVCLDCIREHPREALALADLAHKMRGQLGMPGRDRRRLPYSVYLLFRRAAARIGEGRINALFPVQICSYQLEDFFRFRESTFLKL